MTEPRPSAKCMQGMEILVVSPTPTWPDDFGNRKRILSVCAELRARGACIHFLHYPAEFDWREKIPMEAAAAMKLQWDHYYVVPPTRPLHTDPQGHLHTIDEWWDPAIGQHVRWLAERISFDAVIVNYTWLSKALEFVPHGILKVLDTHDKFSHRAELLEDQGIRREFFYTTPEEEFKGLARADLVWAIKPHEELFFRELLAKHAHAGTEVRTLLHHEAPRDSAATPARTRNGYVRFGIIGARNNINVTNFTRFYEVARPIFEAANLPAQVAIAGTACTDLGDKIDHPFFELLGRVDSVDEFYHGIDAALVPMDFSTGLKIKVGEALAFGCPVLAHAHAFEGYPPTHPLHTCASFEDIARAMVEIAYEPERLADLARASQASYELVARRFEETLDHLAERIRRYPKRALVRIDSSMQTGSAQFFELLWALDLLEHEGYRVGIVAPDTGNYGFLSRLKKNYPVHLYGAEAGSAGPTELEVQQRYAISLVWNLANDLPVASPIPGETERKGEAGRLSYVHGATAPEIRSREALEALAAYAGSVRLLRGDSAPTRIGELGFLARRRIKYKSTCPFNRKHLQEHWFRNRPVREHICVVYTGNELGLQVWRRVIERSGWSGDVSWVLSDRLATEAAEKGAKAIGLSAVLQAPERLLGSVPGRVVIINYDACKQVSVFAWMLIALGTLPCKISRAAPLNEQIKAFTAGMSGTNYVHPGSMILDGGNPLQ